MRCSDPGRRGLASLLSAAAMLLALTVTTAAQAHKSSDAYLQLDAGVDHLDLRLDLALRDLDQAIDLDGNGDGRLTWGEIKAAWPRIDSYAATHLSIDGCPLAPAGRGLERRSDGAYAVLRYTSPCRLAAPAPIRYTMFADVDPTHRGIAKVQRAGGGPELVVLDPARAAGVPPVEGSSSAASGAAAAAASSPSRWQFLDEGVRHILGGYDHVLFLICLLLPAVLRRTEHGWQPVGRMRDAILPIVGIVSAFTVAHSITLGLAAMKIVSLPSAFIEPAIAVTIMLAALDNLWPVFPVRRFVVAFCFGLVHGFGFASVLAELELPTADFAWALLQFNVGLEAGQLMIVLVATTLLFTIRRWRRYRPVVVAGGSLVAMTIAALWFIERTAGVSILSF